MTKGIKILIAAGVILLLATGVLLRSLSGDATTERRRLPDTIVRVEIPTRETVVDRRLFTADVAPIQQANIFSKVSGNLERVYVDMGTRVARNQLLALIDTTELSQQYQQAAATYVNALANDGRTRELFDQNLVSKQDRDNADAAMKVSRAAFETARTRLAYAWITAPFSGYITHRFLDPGALVNTNSSTLFTLMDLSAMKVTINVLEHDIPLIAKGKKAYITVDAYPGKTFTGSVTRYAEAVDLSTRTMAVEIDVPNPTLELKPGMFASVTLVVDEHPKALTIPTQAVLKDDKGYYLFVTRQGIAHRIPVTPGLEQDTRTEILTGILAADTVVTVGQAFLKDGAAIIVQH